MTIQKIACAAVILFSINSFANELKKTSWFGVITSLHSKSNAGDEANRTQAFENKYLNLDYARLQFRGELDENLEYRLRFRFNKKNEATTSDSLGEHVDYLYLSHKFSFAKLTVGRQAVTLCGTEEAFGSFKRYLLSRACDVAQGSKYSTGASLHFGGGEHKYGLYVGNSGNDFLGSGASKTKYDLGAYGIYYKGKFFEDQLKMIINFANFNRGAVYDGLTGLKSTKESNDQFVGLGFEMNFYPVVLFLDYTQANEGTPTLVGGSDKLTASYSLWTKYHLDENMRVALKLEWSKMGDDSDQLDSGLSSAANSAAYDDKKAYSIVFEYEPGEKKNYQYFANYVMEEYTDSDTDKSKFVDHLIRIGVRAELSVF